jgi:hypothetical protein
MIVSTFIRLNTGTIPRKTAGGRWGGLIFSPSEIAASGASNRVSRQKLISPARYAQNNGH